MHLYAILLAALCCIASNANAADRKSVSVSELEEYEVYFVGACLQKRGLISHEQHLFSTEEGEKVQESGYYCNCVKDGKACRRFFDERRTDYLTGPLASALAHVQENHP
ncbi:hypothetical protein EBZ39_09975, partial [bacterium]|nr:hypothetical protein [bacterium]